MTQEIAYDVALTEEQGEALRDFIAQVTIVSVPAHIDLLSLNQAYMALKQVFGPTPSHLERQ